MTSPSSTSSASSRRPHALLLGLALLWGACSDETSALVQVLRPLNGASDVDLQFKPYVQLHSTARVDASNRAIVLYDITTGKRVTVGGSVAVEDEKISYEPTNALLADHNYLLEIQRTAVTDGEFEEMDGSEWPDEAITWPFAVLFTTRSAPRVRGAYLLDGDGQKKISVRFSQPMSPVATGQAIKLYDGVTYTALSLGALVWAADNMSVLVDVKAKLDGASLYVLKVDAAARSMDNTALDGDADGNPGEKSDHFCTSFSGIQVVIYSRLGRTGMSKCPP